MSRAESPEKQDQVTSPRMGGDGGDENAESGKLPLALSAFLLCSPQKGSLVGMAVESTLTSGPFPRS